MRVWGGWESEAGWNAVRLFGTRGKLISTAFWALIFGHSKRNGESVRSNPSGVILSAYFILFYFGPVMVCNFRLDYGSE